MAWTDFGSRCRLFEKELDEVSGRLRRDEMRRLAGRVERWVKTRLGELVGPESYRLGSGRAGSGAPETGDKATSSLSSAGGGSNERDIWDRVWAAFTACVAEAESRLSGRARASLDATAREVEVGLWRLRRRSWVALRERVADEVADGNLLLKLRENFEDKFRYDDAGVPRIWRPTDDIEGLYTRARESTLALIPVLARFRLSTTYAPPDLAAWIGPKPQRNRPPPQGSGDEEEAVEVGNDDDEEDLVPIGGVDDGTAEDGDAAGGGHTSLEEEMTVLSESRRQDLVVRFKKIADGVYVEAKRSAIGGIAQVPLYFYVLLLVPGWNEIILGESSSPAFLVDPFSSSSLSPFPRDACSF